MVFFLIAEHKEAYTRMLSFTDGENLCPKKQHNYDYKLQTFKYNCEIRSQGCTATSGGKS